MEWLTAIGSAVAAFFGWKTKTDLTPEKKEIQQARKERDENGKIIDNWMRDGNANSVSDAAHGKSGGDIK